MGAVNNFVDSVARAGVALRALLGGSSGQDFAVKKLTAADTITPHTTKGIVGTTLGDNAQAGSVGETIESIVLSGSAVAVTSGVNVDVTSITLTPGDWDVFGRIAHNPAGGASYTVLTGCINSTSGTINDDTFTYREPGGFAPGNAVTFPISVTRFNVSVNTTIYLIARAVFTGGTSSAFGRLTARRRR